jgi:hypothetical protein
VVYSLDYKVKSYQNITTGDEKMKISKLSIIIGLIISLFAIQTHAFDLEEGDPVSGRDLFQNCRKCHDGNKSRRLNPNHKTKKQWLRLFKNEGKGLKRKMPDFVTYDFKEKDLMNIHRYLSSYALDSDQPLICE